MFYLTEKSNKTRFVFPSMPESVSISNSTRYQSYPLISNAVKVAKGIEVKKISWSGEFFGISKIKETIVLKNRWKEPGECIRTIEKWQSSNAVLNLIITDCGINLDVTISSLSYDAYGAYGNLKYSITLEKYEPLKIGVVGEGKAGSDDTKKKTAERVPVKKSKTYTIVTGDSLWKIAKKLYGSSGSGWLAIYKANQDVIESAAKKHGRKSSDKGGLIYAGTQLNIPVI